MDHRVTSFPAGPEKPGSWEWAACGASATGSQHIARGQGCDDAYGYGIAGDFVVAAVADGAGSVSGTSAWGAHAACQSVVDAAMKPRFANSFLSATGEHGELAMRWLFDAALARIAQQAEVMGLPVARLSTTLSVALASPRMTVFGQIGDGIIAAEHDGTIETLLIEDKGEYPNTTWFVQSDGAFDASFRTCTQLNTNAFALSTDGMSYKITNVGTGEAYAPFFKGSWDHVRSDANSASFAAMLRGIEDDQTGDDKTMVLVVRRWEVDEYHPSARPQQRIIVTSSPPPADAKAAEPMPEPATVKLVDTRHPQALPARGQPSEGQLDAPTVPLQPHADRAPVAGIAGGDPKSPPKLRRRVRRQR
jgi:Protein phosphatase 2C